MTKTLFLQENNSEKEEPNASACENNIKKPNKGIKGSFLVGKWTFWQRF